ncbi:MAG TPA: DEAD/DEAH box helicase [Verrucomicrobiae bacterium]|nr:DEAD/DEAH box helicase [Verrucomicrobiae bacterium]
MQRFQFHPAVAQWFEQTFGAPTEPQAQGWPALQSGQHALIAAPTGAGKTLAAFLAALDSLFRLGLENQLRDETYVVYVSPLKALSNDIHKNLEQPLAGIRAVLAQTTGREIEVRSAVRTGDTPASRRAAMLKRPPHILVTTPESLYLLLTSASGRRMLSTVRALIVDEIHAVVGNRRGAHLALSMERLAALTPTPPQRIGLSATQRPIEEVARFLVGSGQVDAQNRPACAIVDAGHRRELDLAIELPGSPLGAVMSNEVWTEVYQRLTELIQSHQTTLIFVNTRRMAERAAANLASLLGEDKVASHHGSLSAKLRLDAENRLKRGELRALVATSSLELGIDIGAVQLVCQLGPTRSIAACLQRVGRAEHRLGGLPKGRLFPLTRDELIESLATVQAIRRGELDVLHIPDQPLDILAQQIVAAVSVEDWEEDKLFAMVRRAWPYRNLAADEFLEIIRMLSEGISSKRGRRAALVHYDAINRRIRGRRGSQLLALTSGGAIADNSDYRVILEPGETFIGTVNEDFAVESVAGDIFQLGNTSWKILKVATGAVRVEDAHGQPPGLPFWLGEAPARTDELSAAVSRLRHDAEETIARAPGLPATALADALAREPGLSQSGALQLADYLTTTQRALGALPTQDKLVMERFFDESGGMQLVIHSPFGARLNRAWGLALRKRFCRSFNFELQSAATDNAIVLSLGTQHSFPLADVFRYLHSNTVREVLVQALLDAPMFAIRWRWNASRSLALPRFRHGHRTPPPLQRMEAENLLAAVFPDQLACLENIVGDRVVPDHPLVKQTIDDCLTEAMDIEGLEALLRRIENHEIECVAMDLPEPSPLAHEIIHARPYAFLDNAPLEERRTQAVLTRRAGEPSGAGDGGILDAAAIERVVLDAWPQAGGADELHEILLLLGVVTEVEARRATPDAPALLAELAAQKRAGQMTGSEFWIAAERLPLVQAVYPNASVDPPIVAPEFEARKIWERADAIRELVRGRMEVVGPITAATLAEALHLPISEIDQALLALENEGFILRGKFHPEASEVEWCDRRLLARIHRLTINRLRAEIQPVSLAEFQRFLFVWQHVAEGRRMEGLDGLAAALEQLDGCELAAGAWEPSVLAARVQDYTPQWLDQLCLTGRVGWGRLSPPRESKSRAAPLRSSPVALFSRAHLGAWLDLRGEMAPPTFSPDTQLVWETLRDGGALFFGEIAQRARLLQTRVEEALGELAAAGWVTADSFEGLRALLLPADKRAPFGDLSRARRHRVVGNIELAGRWSLLRRPDVAADDSREIFARALLRRYGVVFRRLLERESLPVSWFDLGRIFRRLEARGEIRGGYFVNGVSGEQFALPEAVGLLRSVRKEKPQGELIVLSAVDPLHLNFATARRITAVRGNRILFRDGVPIAGLEAGEVLHLERDHGAGENQIEQALKIGRLPALLRPYYS